MPEENVALYLAALLIATIGSIKKQAKHRQSGASYHLRYNTNIKIELFVSLGWSFFKGKMPKKLNLKLATEDSKTKKLWAATSWAEKKDFVKLFWNISSPLWNLIKNHLHLKIQWKMITELEKTAIR